MSDIDKAFAGSIPKLYETYLVPLIFVAAGIALLSLVTIVWLPASVFILAGRILVFVWALAVSFTALRKSQQA